MGMQRFVSNGQFRERLSSSKLRRHGYTCVPAMHSYEHFVEQFAQTLVHGDTPYGTMGTNPHKLSGIVLALDTPAHPQA